MLNQFQIKGNLTFNPFWSCRQISEHSEQVATWQPSTRLSTCTHEDGSRSRFQETNIIVSIKVEEGVQTSQHFKNMTQRCFVYKKLISNITIQAGSSAGKESTCKAGDPSSIPGSGRSSGEEIGYPLQGSWASLVAQMVKNPPTMRESKPGFDPQVGKIPWRREQLPTPVFWPGEFHGQRSLAGYSPRGCKELDVTERLSRDRQAG